VSFKLHAHGKAVGIDEPVLGRVTFRGVEMEERADHVLAMHRWSPEGDRRSYAGLLIGSTPSEEELATLRHEESAATHSLSWLDHLADGDVVALEPTGYVRTLSRQGSHHNAIFATDRCNSFCVMCSQPPKAIDDRSRIREHLRLVDLIDPDTRELGITGGEPTLLKDDLLRLIARCKERLPETALHVLSNGRLFYYGSFARKLGAIGHPDLMFGVPVYSDLPAVHNYVVQAEGAFEQTLVGLQNLGRYGVPVEIRVVIHRHTYARLPQLAEFIYRNLTFASQVTFMGLELMGFAVANLDDLWIDPFDYQRELREAVFHLAARGMRVSIYNHQLCLVPRELWPYCCQSISDWKNDYLPVCDDCAEKERCGGFFTSSLRRRVSQHLAPIRPDS
jgi:His-Xaa-Ser system radical SAM maturase HxsC